MTYDTFREHAVNRIRDLLDGRLGEEGGVVPIPNRIPDEELSDIDPRVAVSGQVDSTAHNRKHRRKTGRIRVSVDATEEFVESETTLALNDIQQEVIDELDAERDGWLSNGVTRTEEPAYDEQLDRFLGVVESTHERIETRPQHD